MMQRIKELMNDLGGSIVAGGSANVLTVTAASPFTGYADGQRVRFRAAADNTGAATLNVNAIGAKPLVKFTPTGETALEAREIQEDGIYEAVYSADLNGSSGAWLLINPTTPSAPAGMVSSFAMSTAPNGWLECNGAAVSRTTYAALFAAIGTSWGAGDGTTTFNIPQLRGEFLRGWDNGRGVDTGRAFASAQAEAFKSHTHTGTTSSNGGFSLTATRVQSSTTDNVYKGGSTAGDPITVDPHDHTFTTAATGGTETRPRNVALLFCVKT